MHCRAHCLQHPYKYIRVIFRSQSSSNASNATREPAGGSVPVQNSGVTDSSVTSHTVTSHTVTSQTVTTDLSLPSSHPDYVNVPQGYNPPQAITNRGGDYMDMGPTSQPEPPTYFEPRPQPQTALYVNSAHTAASC